MRQIFELLPTVVFVVVMICWFVFAGVFLLRKKPPSPPDRKREPGSLFGVALQGVSFGVVWGVRRTMFSPIVAGREWITIVTGVIAIVAAIGSVWLVTLAVKTLGKEWSLTARLVEGHKLATSGPYALVRHPIYTSMLGMLLATGLALSHWAALLPALLVFFIGTTIRIRSEEKLLREAFGEQFENYARNVRAIVPGLY
ncbi:MAG TPA: isoprenylcysteine carboxylmethyltransferase family protein [Pyrinomonadaceae bacterium]|jgi:protein-S-isoprenylcysteine O-methyltransferase Ste14|nr:isoprenylcysteine carboxylmethyltransferase family protein [Pyrinomonadaceae bacterium]